MRRFSSGLLLVIGLIGSQSSLATLYDVLRGSEYLVTPPGTTLLFSGVPFVGVPIGPGGSDTIIERLQDVSLGTGAPASGTTPIRITQEVLESAIPVDFGLGVGIYYVTLQSARGGPASTGSLTMNLNVNDDHVPSTAEGTFSGSMKEFIDVRLGSPIGPIAQSLVRDSTIADGFFGIAPFPWDANPMSSVFLVPGLVGDVTANFHTNKVQNLNVNDMDFFAIGAFSSLGVAGAIRGGIHFLADATVVPEPGTTALIGLGLAGLAATRRRKMY